MNTITLELRPVYGATRAYPACDTSRIFADMLGRKTLTKADLSHIERLGYAIKTTSNASLEDVQ